MAKKLPQFVCYVGHHWKEQDQHCFHGLSQYGPIPLLVHLRGSIPVEAGHYLIDQLHDRADGRIEMKALFNVFGNF